MSAGSAGFTMMGNAGVMDEEQEPSVCALFEDKTKSNNYRWMIARLLGAYFFSWAWIGTRQIQDWRVKETIKKKVSLFEEKISAILESRIL